LVERVVHARPGSALRLSQPLSGFLATPSFAALFHAATVPGISPSECSPHRNRAPLPGSLVLPCGYPQSVLRRHVPGLVAACFPDSRAFDAVAWFLRRLWVSFSRTRERASRSPWTRVVEPPRSTRFTRFGALILLRVRSHLTRVAPDQAVVPLLGFCPSRVLLTGASDPQPVQA
jgi:hypothetical protein